MAQLLPNIIWTALDADAKVASGAEVSFFLAGTTSPTDVWHDAAEGTPWDQPIAALSDGRWPTIYTPADKLVKAVITGAGADRTIDPANIILTAGDMPFEQDGSGAVSQTIEDFLQNLPAVSPRDFGGVGNNGTDDTAAITAALDTGRNVTLGKGNWKVAAGTGTIFSLATAGQRIHMDGGTLTFYGGVANLISLDADRTGIVGPGLITGHIATAATASQAVKIGPNLDDIVIGDGSLTIESFGQGAIGGPPSTGPGSGTLGRIRIDCTVRKIGNSLYSSPSDVSFGVDLRPATSANGQALIRVRSEALVFGGSAALKVNNMAEVILDAVVKDGGQGALQLKDNGFVGGHVTIWYGNYDGYAASLDGNTDYDLTLAVRCSNAPKGPVFISGTTATGDLAVSSTGPIETITGSVISGMNLRLRSKHSIILVSGTAAFNNNSFEGCEFPRMQVKGNGNTHRNARAVGATSVAAGGQGALDITGDNNDVVHYLNQGSEDTVYGLALHGAGNSYDDVHSYTAHSTAAVHNVTGSTGLRTGSITVNSGTDDLLDDGTGTVALTKTP